MPLAKLNSWLLFGALSLSSCTESDSPPSVLFISVDTTRADALNCSGGDHELTPNLDALAADGVLYSRAHTVAPLTLPAHASMLTGLYPLRHGLRENSMGSLPEEAQTTAEALAAAGYDTAAFVAALVLDDSFGLAQGFEIYEGPARRSVQATSHFTESKGGEVVDAAISHIEQLAAAEPGRPFFVWTHFFDPHYPYEAPPEFAARSAQPYLGEIAYLDHEVGRLLDALARLELNDETLVILVADHGEAFGEHEEVTHGAYCWQSTLRVPFLIRYPDRHRAGEISDEIVSVVDVHATALAAAGLSIPKEIDGKSLYRAAVSDDRGVYFESYSGFFSYGWSPLSGWLDARGKYLHSSEPLFFDPWTDPTESRDLSVEREADLGHYRRAIGELAARPALQASASGAGTEMVEAIRGLGYASGGAVVQDVPHPLDVGDRPSPQSMVRQDRMALEVMEMNNSGRYIMAESAALRLLQMNKDNWFALDQLSLALMRMNQFEEAVGPLERLVKDGPPWAHIPFRLGNCYAFENRFEEAAPLFARALEQDPKHPEYRKRLAACLDRLGRSQDAARVRVGAADARPQ